MPYGVICSTQVYKYCTSLFFALKCSCDILSKSGNLVSGRVAFSETGLFLREVLINGVIDAVEDQSFKEFEADAE